MLDVNEAKTGAKALYLQAALLSGLDVSAQSPEELAIVVEKNFFKVPNVARPLAVAALLKLIAAALESAVDNNDSMLHESSVSNGQDKVCPIYPFTK